MNFSDDTEFFTLSYMEEASQFTPDAVWNHGGEYYEVEVSCRIPHAICEDEDAIDAFIDEHQHLEGFWVDNPAKQRHYHTTEHLKTLKSQVSQHVEEQKQAQFKEAYESMNSMSRILASRKP